jgi:pSer/pThr/pTyr-binding forkhead associated (FHA) protein
VTSAAAWTECLSNPHGVTLEALDDALGETSVDGFVAGHEGPFLVALPPLTGRQKEQAQDLRARMAAVRDCGVAGELKVYCVGALVERFGIVGRTGPGLRMVFEGDTSISKEHAKLERDEEAGWLLEDLGSTNGTFVDGRRLSQGHPVPVAPGRQVRFGTWESVMLTPKHLFAVLRAEPNREVFQLGELSLECTGLPLRNLVPALQALSRDDFLALDPPPFFLQVPTSLTLDAGQQPPANALRPTARVSSEVLLGVKRSKKVGQARVFALASRWSDSVHVVAGRNHRRCDLVLDHESVSSRHAQFRLADDTWTLVDLDSGNGTFHNGERLLPGSAAFLEDRDVVWFAGYWATYLEPAALVHLVQDDLGEMAVVMDRVRLCALVEVEALVALALLVRVGEPRLDRNPPLHAVPEAVLHCHAFITNLRR